MTDPRDWIFVAFDTETTGLTPQQANVVEIAGIRFTGAGDEISRFSMLANPGGPMSPEVIRIHGISNAMVSRAPTPSEACRKFSDWLHEDDVLVAHNAVFDVRFISTELTRGGHLAPKNRVVDSLRLTRCLELPVANYKLATLVEHFGFPETGYHRAMADSIYVMNLMVRLIDMIPPREMIELLRRATGSSHEVTAPSTAVSQRFAHVLEAIHRGDALTMRYVGERPQRVLPLAFCSHEGVDCLRVLCLTDSLERRFELDRIIELCAAETSGR